MLMPAACIRGKLKPAASQLQPSKHHAKETMVCWLQKLLVDS
jgi:hypothetical protein